MFGLRVIVFLCTAGAVLATDCPDGWLAFESSCYLIGHELVSFGSAEIFCRLHSNSHLVHIDNSEENMFLEGYFGYFASTNFWLGIKDELIEGVWKWSDIDVTAEFTAWSPGEPQGHQQENCALFYGRLDYRWVDASCLTKAHPVCEFHPRHVNPDVIG